MLYLLCVTNVKKNPCITHPPTTPRHTKNFHPAENYLYIFYDCGVWKWITCVCGPIKHSSCKQSLVTELSIELWHLVQRWRHFQPARKLDTKSIWRWQKAGQHISVGLPSSMLRIHTRQARLDKGGSTGSIFRLHHLQSDIWGQIW